MPDEPEISGECLFCGLTVPAIDVATADALLEAIPAYRMGPAERGRTFKVGELYLLHHGCLSMQARTEDGPYWDPDSAWWACKDLERPLDKNAHFDLNCRECAVRWASDLVP